MIILYPKHLLAEWVLFDELNKYTKNYAKMYYDDNLIDKKGSNIWVWVLANLEKSIEGDFSYVLKYRLDCKKYKMKVLTFESFSIHQTKTGSHQGKRTGATEMNKYIEFKKNGNSTNASMFRTLCKVFN